MTEVPNSVSATNGASGRIVKYAELKPCRDAFIDTRSPGSDQKENFTIIGPGVAENPNQFVHITEPHGFNIGGARQPPGCLNSQHSHETVEVFYVHSGQWRFMTGEHGNDGEVRLGPGDLISIPTQVFRGFENVGTDTGFLWAVLGGDDPGRVMWAPYVFDMAKDHGLVLLENGTLIDTLRGDVVPADAHEMPVTSASDIASLSMIDSAALERCVVRSDAARPAAFFGGVSGVRERVLVGEQPIVWPHGFTIAELSMEPDAEAPTHILDTADVWFIQSGKVEVTIGDSVLVCGAGDTVTVPLGKKRSLTNCGCEVAKIVQVRGGNMMPELLRS